MLNWRHLFLWMFIAVLLSPLFSLFGALTQPLSIDSEYLQLAISNTTLVALLVSLFATSFGFLIAFAHSFKVYPGRRIIHGLFLLPLAFPAYVLSFIYLGLVEDLSWLRKVWEVELQGNIYFLCFVLFLSLVPYSYFFCTLGFSFLRQSQWETHQILGGSLRQLITHQVLPTLTPFMLSAMILVLFECLSDFGAASVVNISVMTTLIYKYWFDLFSFSQALALSGRYLLVIASILIIELLFRTRQSKDRESNREPIHPQAAGPLLSVVIVLLATLYLLFGLAIPLSQLFKWVIVQWDSSLLEAVMPALKNSFQLGLLCGVLVLALSLLVLLPIRRQGGDTRSWLAASSIGYSVPGSLLAVGFYSLLLTTFESVNESFLYVALILALSYKFFTVAMRTTGESCDLLPQDLFEVSKIMNVSWWRQVQLFYWPYLQQTSWVAIGLVVIEVVKEMPLTLMLAPGDYQTLSIQIFNYTSEGDWHRAAYPSLFVVLVGFLAVLLVNDKRSEL